MRCLAVPKTGILSNYLIYNNIKNQSPGRGRQLWRVPASIVYSLRKAPLCRAGAVTSRDRPNSLLLDVMRKASRHSGFRSRRHAFSITNTQVPGHLPGGAAHSGSVPPGSAHTGLATVISGRTGWGGRIRTCGTRYQKPLPYHLATPQPCGATYAAPQMGSRPLKPKNAFPVRGMVLGPIIMRCHSRFGGHTPVRFLVQIGLKIAKGGRRRCILWGCFTVRQTDMAR